MNKTKLIIMFVALICLGMGGFFMMTGAGYGSESGKHANGKIKLPEPKYESDTSVEKALLERRSVRRYKDEPLTLGEVSQLLWAAQGITGQRYGFK
ncbi:MAG TPA: nitroreductase family protein, partial [Acetomicrobium sp.]|nr:nitroreductase family protein [Acetomicrobium sp.]